MPAESAEIIFSIEGKGAADHEQLARLTEGLREDLIEVGAGSVDRLREGEAPAGSKGEPITLASLLVTLAPAALPGLIAMLQSWLTRNERVTLTMKRGEDQITFSGSLSKDQRGVITDWLNAGTISRSHGA